MQEQQDPTAQQGRAQQARVSVSSWMDGDLSDDELRQMMATLKAEPDLAEDWNTYHLIGDVLRGADAKDVAIDLRGRLSKALDAEPAIVAPAVLPAAAAPQRGPSWLQSHWLTVATAAAAVLFVGAVAWQVIERPDSGVSMVSAGRVDPARMSDYLLAHDRIAPASLVQPVNSVSGEGR